MKKDTIKAATGLRSRVEMVSLTRPRALSCAGINAHAAPPSMPSRAMIGSSNQPGSSAKVSAANVARQAPMYSWPSPPTLIKPTREGSATARAVSSNGVIVTTTSDNPYVLPSVETRMSR